MADNGLVQMDSGVLLDEFKRNLSITIDTATNTMSGRASYRNMGQLENIKFNLTANS
jgi:hypothetical protein